MCAPRFFSWKERVGLSKVTSKAKVLKSFKGLRSLAKSLVNSPPAPQLKKSIEIKRNTPFKTLRRVARQTFIKAIEAGSFQRGCRRLEMRGKDENYIIKSDSEFGSMYRSYNRLSTAEEEEM